MPARIEHPTVYIGPQGSIDKLNVATLYKGGELGQRVIDTQGREYQIVLCDSGPASVAAGNLAFWMSRSGYKVTNKLADAPEGRNGIAGIFNLIVTPGNYCSIQIGGPSKTNVTTDGAPSQGMIAVADSGTTAGVIGIPAGTAPTYVPLGVFTGATSAGATPVQITIGVPGWGS